MTPHPRGPARDRTEPSPAARRVGGRHEAGPAAAPPRAPDRRREDARTESRVAAARDFLWRLYKKLEEDNFFFLAGAIAFKVIIAFVPLLLATLGIAGLFLRSRYGDRATEQVLRYIAQALPPLNDPLITRLSGGLDELLSNASGFVGVGALLLIFLATSIVGTLRTALREIFDLQEDRGIIAGKFYDMAMVIAAGTFLALNAGLTLVLQVVGTYGRGFLGLDPARFEAFDSIVVNVLAFISIWFMFVLIYRYLPARRIHWRIAFISATFAGILFEAMKTAFGWYVRNVASYSSTYGNFATIIVFLLWVYYNSVAFIIGGEVGQVAALRRIRRQQKERLN